MAHSLYSDAQRTIVCNIIEPVVPSCFDKGWHLLSRLACIGSTCTRLLDEPHAVSIKALIEIHRTVDNLRDFMVDDPFSDTDACDGLLYTLCNDTLVRPVRIGEGFRCLLDSQVTLSDLQRL